MNNLKKLLYYQERVKKINDFEGYYITDQGRVFSSKKRVTYKTLKGVEYECIIWKELKQFYTHQYKTVTLVQKGKKRKNIYVHRLMYETFHGNYNTHYFKIVYKDMNTENCILSNLKLEFRNKSRENILKYNRQKHLLSCLNDYTEVTGSF